MIGAIIGDIVGSRFERANCKSTKFELFTKRCSFTDDTVMTLAIAKALLESDNDWSRLRENAVKCMQEIGRRYPNCGYGQMFYLWLHKRNPKPYNSFGNGAAMRVSSVAYVAETIEQCIELSDIVTGVSHNHPEGLKGAQAAAVATWAALQEMPKQEIRELIEDRFYDLNFTIDEIRPKYRFDASCQGSVPQAIKAFLESDDFESAIRLAMGTLLVNISQGMELDEAVRKYEVIVAPTNYKRPKAIYTKKMLENAKQTISDLGYLSSLGRRFATLDDITVNNILFANRNAAQRIRTGTDIFSEMERDIAVDPKKFSRVQEISIEVFVKNVLPTATSVETLLENRHAANMVSLIAPADKDSKTMFKWANGFSWAYSGNITDSDIRENVKMAGGKVDGILRFSIQWNDEDFCPNDYDAHCRLPDGREIYFHERLDRVTLGELDIDIIHPQRGTPAVENIVWPSMTNMKPGTYLMYVHCYTNSGGRSGFKAEVEFDGTIHSFEYKKEFRRDEVVKVAEVTYDPVTGFTIKDLIPSSVSTRDIWGLKSNQFVPVSVVMYSPNYWDEQDGIGHRHYFFMLKDCVNPERPNGFYNEFLKPELEQHRRVFEALGSKTAVQDVNDQLSGLGFSATKRNNLLVKVKGATERILKITF